MLDDSLQNGLAVFYVLAALMNGAFATYYCCGPVRDRTKSIAWSLVGAFFLLHAVLYALHRGPAIPGWMTEGVDYLMGPVTYTTLSIALFTVMLVYRRFFVNPQVAWGLLNLSLL